MNKSSESKKLYWFVERLQLVPVRNIFQQNGPATKALQLITEAPAFFWIYEPEELNLKEKKVEFRPPFSARSCVQDKS